MKTIRKEAQSREAYNSVKKKKSLLLQWETPSKRTQISMAF